MKSSTTAPGDRSSKIPGFLYLSAAVAIFASSGAITRRLIELGAQHPVHGHNPISLCNLLFVGNLCALMVLLPLHRKQLTLSVLRRLSSQDWLGMLTVAVLAGALAPAFFLIALSMTMVNNVTLVGRIEPLLTLVLSAIFLGERLNFWQGLGAAVSFAGVLVIVALQGAGAGSMTAFSAGGELQGELFTAIAAVALAVASVVSRARLASVPVGTFSIVRTGLGTVVFFWLAIFLYGSNHFAEAFSPLLWRWMLLYGTLIVVVGQSLWLQGLKRSGASEAALAETFHPVEAVLAAYLLLGEVPTQAQYVGGCVILAGVVMSFIGVWLKRKAAGQTDGEPQKVWSFGFRGM